MAATTFRNRTWRTGDYGSYRCTTNPATSRQFDPDTDDPRMVIAEVIAKRDGWAEIRPGHWATAGAIVKALKGRDMVKPKRERNPQ